MSESIGVIILAAGSSTRLGHSKQLVTLEGSTLLARSVKTSNDAGLDNITIVLGAAADIHKKAIEQFSTTVVINPNWQAGIGTSIKAGVNGLIDSKKNITSALLLVCDQPLLKAIHLKTLIKVQQETQKGIVASSYASTVGVPVLFLSRYFDDLMSLPDSQGAKSVIHHHLHDTSLVEFPDGAFDIDTHSDLERLLNQTRKK